MAPAIVAPSKAAPARTAPTVFSFIISPLGYFCRAQAAKKDSSQSIDIMAQYTNSSLVYKNILISI
jgi:hypothetical protein